VSTVPEPPNAPNWDVQFSAQVAEWITGADDKTNELAWAAIRVLERDGPNLGRPLVDSVKKSRHNNMKELRPGSSGKSEIRILFAFDKIRRGILLVAGDKSGDWNKWYDKNIPIADDLFDEHQKGLGK